MNLEDIQKKIEEERGPVIIGQTLNLITCDNFKLFSGRPNARKLKWKQPTVTWLEKLYAKIFNKDIDNKPYLTWDGPNPIFERYAFGSVEEFLDIYSKDYIIDEDLNVHMKPYIVVWHGDTSATFHFDTIEEANEVYRMMQKALTSSNVPTVVNEKFEGKRLSVVPASKPEETAVGCTRAIPEYLAENLTNEQLENMVDMMERTDKMRENKQ